VPFNNAELQKKEAKAAPVHYIFALDESGSMSGSPWSKLLMSMKSTIEKIASMDAGKNLLRVSLIKFDDTASIIHDNYAPGQVNTNLPCRGGGTIFDPPFNLAASLAAKYISTATIVFIFMTDGGASYPSTGIQALKQLQKSYPNKLKYVGIEFGSSVQVMKTIKT